MSNLEEPNLVKRVIVPNVIISAIFRLILFGVNPLLGWEMKTSELIVYFAFYVLFLLLVDYFVYLRPYRRWKSSKATRTT